MIFKHRLFSPLLGLLFATVLTEQASALYDPGVGRFCSRDPIGFADGVNRYKNYFSPNAIDPSGHKCELIGPATNVTNTGWASVGALAFSPGLNPGIWSFAPASDLLCCHRKTQYFGYECTCGWWCFKRTFVTLRKKENSSCFWYKLNPRDAGEIIFVSNTTIIDLPSLGPETLQVNIVQIMPGDQRKANAICLTQARIRKMRFVPDPIPDRSFDCP